MIIATLADPSFSRIFGFVQLDPGWWNRPQVSFWTDSVQYWSAVCGSQKVKNEGLTCSVVVLTIIVYEMVDPMLF